MEPITLDIRHADGRHERIAVTRPVFIGRNRTNDIVLNDTAVAGDHAQIDADADGWQILDLGGQSGTEVDGIRLQSYTPQHLHHGSTIRVGSTRMTVRVPTPTPVEVVAPVAAPVAVAAAPLPTTVMSPEDTLLQVMLGAPVKQQRRRIRTEPLDALAPAPAELVVQLSPAELATEVNKTIAATVRVTNRSPYVDRVTLAIEGLGEWADVQPHVMPLRPGETAEAQATFSPPRAPASRAGRHAFEITASSEKSPELRFTASGSLAIKAYTDYQMELLDPRAVTGWHAGRYQVQITNRGNQAQSFTLEGRDDERAFVFRFRPEPLGIPPGERRVSVARAGIRAARLLGQPRTYPFTITAMPGDQSAPPQMAEARFVQRPPVPLWLLKGALLLVVALAILAAAVALWRWGPIAVAAVTPPRTVLPTLAPTRTAAPTSTAIPTPAFVLAATAIPQVTTIVVTREVQLPAPPPQVIVPTVVVDIPAPPAPAPPVITVVAPPPVTPMPVGPDQLISFGQVAGVPISVRQPVRGDEYAGQDAVLCAYRQSAQGLGGLENAPATVNGVTLRLDETPDPVTSGQQVTYNVTIENSVVGRAIRNLAISARLRPGLAFVSASTPACIVQSDGSVVCSMPEVGSTTTSVSITALANQPGTGGLDVGATLLVREPGAPADATIVLEAAAETAILEAPALPHCGLEQADFVQGRPEFATLTQVMPVIEPAPVGQLAIPAHVFTADDATDRQLNDTVLTVTFQRVVAEARVGVWFAGPANNFYVVHALDEQGRLIGSFRTDRLAAPAQYQLAVQGVERPIKQLVIQNLAADDGTLRSAGGVYLTSLEFDYTRR